MCGIYGFVDENRKLGDLIDGLKKLEYRGYDSAGIAYITNGRVEIAKSTGRVSVLENTYKDRLSAFVESGISHTRWATHGNPNDMNAHPHSDCSGKIAVVHNGIIENFDEIKYRLVKNGHKFVSETDTEVVAHLIEEYYGGDLISAVRNALKQMRGAYAIGVIHSDKPGTIIAAREGSPLIVGKTSKGGVIASDVMPILKDTRDVYFIDDGEIVEINREKICFYDLDGNEKHKKPQSVDWEEEAAEKMGFKFFMEKEIYEEPRVIESSMIGRLKNGEVFFRELDGWEELLEKIEKITVVAAGTSSHAGYVFKYFMNEILPVKVDVEISSEFRYQKHWGFSEKDLYVFISQSGETYDTLESLKLVKSNGAKSLAISNVLGSTISREADKTIFINAGPEIGVASTKAYIGQLIILYLFGICIAQAKGSEIDQNIIKELQDMKATYKEILETNFDIREVARKYYTYSNFMYIGRGINYPTAMEGALKLKEISYINATAYAGGELKHGPIALLDSDFPVFAVTPDDELFGKMKNNILEVKARNAKTICLTDKEGECHGRLANDTIKMPGCHKLLQPLICAPLIQLFAYHMADLRELDVDKPRNLAKSVTVE